jgi:hypothetical protein
MGYDLWNPHGSWSCNNGYWHYVLNVASAFGWEPKGTAPPADFDGEWEGRYYGNDFQFVTDEDARKLAQALYRAIDAVTSGKELTEKQSKALTPEQTERTLTEVQLTQKQAEGLGLGDKECVVSFDAFFRALHRMSDPIESGTDLVGDRPIDSEKVSDLRCLADYAMTGGFEIS